MFVFGAAQELLGIIVYWQRHHTRYATRQRRLMQRGVPVWQVAGYLGMSVETLMRVCGHHSPDHLKSAAHAIAGKSKPRVSVVESVVGESPSRAKLQKSQ
jgi:hypothetical protein